MLSSEEILQLEGIVVRRIPFVTVSRWRSTEKVMQRHRDSGGETEVLSDGRECMIERKNNSLGGKYLLTFQDNQGSTTIFSIEGDGVGDTITDAYQDYLNKRGMGK